MKALQTTIAVLLVGCLALLFVQGCSKNPVVPAEQDVSQLKIDWLQQQSAPDGPQLGSSLVLPAIDTVLSEFVGRWGGKLQYNEGDDKLEFTIKKYALAKLTQITIRAMKFETPWGPLWVFDCGPEGTTFARPLELEIKGKFSKDFRAMWYFNEETGSWDLEQLIEATGSSREFEINHFSKYGVS